MFVAEFFFESSTREFSWACWAFCWTHVFGGVEEMSMRGAVTINVKTLKNHLKKHGKIKVSHRLRPAMKGFIQSQLPMEKGHV